MVAVRTNALRVLTYDADLEALRMLADRREELTRARVQTVNRLHRLLSELTPGQAKKDITTGQAKPILASVRPRDLAGKTRRRLAAEQLAEPMVVEKKIKALTKELKAMVLARGSRLMDLPGVGPVVAARILADVGGRPVRRPEPVRVLDRDCTPGPGPHPCTPPPENRSGTGSRGPGTGRSTTCSTSPQPPRSGSTPPAAATTDASSPKARRVRKPCAA